MSSDFSGSQIVLGKAFGSLIAMRWSFLPLGFLCFLLVLTRPAYFLVGPAMALTMLAIGAAYVGLGVYFSLISGASSRAMIRSFLIQALMVGA